uniref:NACHT domain-containing protein n=1 Tax=Amphimedon queenslandica TaxID=400682 RepID=A0A1X7TRH3_AMPQE
MIDVSQWRASIGLWNYCQAASSRPANGCHSHSFKAAVDSKSGSTTSGEKTSKLPAALSLIVSLLLSLLRYMKFNFIPPTGIITVTVMIHCLQSLVLFIATIGSSSELIYYLVLLLLLLLSGDVELNPGPIGRVWNWIVTKLCRCLRSNQSPPNNLEHGLSLQMQKSQGSDASASGASSSVSANKPVTSTTSGNPKDILRTHSDKLVHAISVNLYDVTNALYAKDMIPQQAKEEMHVLGITNNEKSSKLVNVIEQQLGSSLNPEQYLIDICHVLINQQHTLTDIATSILHQLGQSIPDVSPHTASNTPIAIFRMNYDTLVDAIAHNHYKVAYGLYAKGLIKIENVDQIQNVTESSDIIKSGRLMSELKKQLEDCLVPKQYLIVVCHVLINQQHHTLTDIATSILHQLGQPIPDNVPSTIPDDVQGYAKNMRQHYKSQPIVATDWPPRIGKDYFGRLALVEKQDSSTQAKSAWHMLRGQVDEIFGLNENIGIRIEDVLRPSTNSQSLRVVIDGPPGIGKTTLCRKLLNMWSNEIILLQQYDLVLYCPLRNSKIATATTLADLFVRQLNRYKNVPEWFEERDGEGLLIIFDGWDELSERLRQSSLAASIICKGKLDQCSVIVTSRSYASSSLLKMDTISRHVQVIGFSKEEISTVIIQTLQKDTKLAQELIDKSSLALLLSKPFTTTQSSKDSQLAVKLINDLKEGGHLPTTLTQLYENFILQTIRRHVKKHDMNPHTLGSLSSLPTQFAKPLQEMCQIAYTNLANTRMTFSSHQLQSLTEAVKEDYLGLMTTFIEYDEEKYQFLHLSIQEFLAAWWIVKHEEKTEEVFKDHFDDDHFRMCLRFVAGLTHLEHESYQQYFNKQLDLQCKRKPLLGYETLHLLVHQNPKIRQIDHIESDDFDNVPILLLQLLYESQNTTLCQVLAQSINNHSLCLYRVSLTLFDWLCLSYCINNSNTIWNHLHLGTASNQSLSIFTAGLTNNSLQTQCKRLVVELYEPTDELIHKLLQPSLLYNIQECYCLLINLQYVPCLVLLQFLNLPQLKILHLKIQGGMHVSIFDNTDKYTELENERKSTIISIIRGVTRNETITSLTLVWKPDLPVGIQTTLPQYFAPYPPPPNQVVNLNLKDNDTLQTLSLDISDRDHLYQALMIGELRWSNELMTSLLPRIKGLHCLILHDPYPPHLLFDSHPSLHTLTLPLDTAENNGHLSIPSSFLSSLTTGLRDNTSLQQLSVPIPLNEETISFINAISQKNNLTELKVNVVDQLHILIDDTDQSDIYDPWEEVSGQSDDEWEEDIGQSVDQLEEDIGQSGDQLEDIGQSVDQLEEAIGHGDDQLEEDIGQSGDQLEDIGQIVICNELVKSWKEKPKMSFFYEHIDTSPHSGPVQDQKKTLIDRHKKEQPHKPLPEVYVV